MCFLKYVMQRDRETLKLVKYFIYAILRIYRLARLNNIFIKYIHINIYLTAAGYESSESNDSNEGNNNKSQTDLLAFGAEVIFNIIYFVTG